MVWNIHLSKYYYYISYSIYICHMDMTFTLLLYFNTNRTTTTIIYMQECKSNWEHNFFLLWNFKVLLLSSALLLPLMLLCLYRCFIQTHGYSISIQLSQYLNPSLYFSWITSDPAIVDSLETSSWKEKFSAMKPVLLLPLSCDWELPFPLMLERSFSSPLLKI